MPRSCPLTLIAGFSLLVAGAVPLSARAQSPHDLIIRNARIVDGTGNPWFRGELAVQGDSIAAIAPAIPGHAARVIDAAGLVVSPGFIDPHTHASRGIFAVPTAENYVRQGVTTIMEGPDGGSPIPLKPFLAKVAAAKISVNWGMFVGQGSVRQAVMGRVNRNATPAEIEQMKELVRQGMRDGAFGLSSGLYYVPGNFTPTEEVIDLARVVGSFNRASTWVRDPSCAHWGRREAWMLVLDAVYGYWSMVASTPRARASSTRLSVSTLLPQFAMPRIL